MTTAFIGTNRKCNDFFLKIEKFYEITQIFVKEVTVRGTKVL